MEILVTGGTGFLGSHLVDRLVAEGHRVRVLIRPTSQLDFLQVHLGEGTIECIKGDLTDPSSLQRACQGVEAIFHAAAAVDLTLSRRRIFKVNVWALERFLEIARARSIRRFVYVGSVGFYRVRPGEPIREDSPCCPWNAYEASKLEAERIVLRHGQTHGLPVTVLEPSAIYGPRARVGIPMMLRLIERGWFPYIDSGHHRLNMVYVSDVVEALIQALQSPQAVGQRLIIGGPSSPTYREIFQTVAKLLGVDPPQRNVSYPVAKAFARLIEIGAKLTGRSPPFASAYLDYAARDMIVDSSRAQQVLGYRPRVDLEEGMRCTVEWFRSGKGTS